VGFLTRERARKIEFFSIKHPMWHMKNNMAVKNQVGFFRVLLLGNLRNGEKKDLVFIIHGMRIGSGRIGGSGVAWLIFDEVAF